MGTIETFDHTADVGLRIRAETLNELFQLAAEGMFDYIVANRDAVRKVERDTISLSSETGTDLLATWLSELIFLSETRHHLYCQFDMNVSSDCQSLEATIHGEPIDRERHELDHEVKAVTRHGLSLRQDGTGWEAELILDI